MRNEYGSPEGSGACPPGGLGVSPMILRLPGAEGPPEGKKTTNQKTAHERSLISPGGGPRFDRSIQFTRRVRRNFDNVGYARAVNCAVGCGLVRVRAASIILYKYGADTHSSSADLLLLSRAARLDRSIPLLIAHATAASNGTASCSDRASRSLAAGCALVETWTFGRTSRSSPNCQSADSSG